MQLQTFFVVLLLLIAKICAARIIIESVESNRDTEITKAAIDLVTTCYPQRGNAVGIGGRISESLVKILSSQLIPLSLINNSTRISVEFSGYQRKFSYKLKVFIIEVSTYIELRTIVNEIQKTLWWNHMASFLILYRSPYDCNKALILLFESWSWRLVNAKIICSQPRIGIIIFGYNPYLIDIPKPWTFFRGQKYKNLKNNYFTIFARLYVRNRKDCWNLDIDKTKNLNGYPVELLYIYNGEVTNIDTEYAIDTGKGKYLANYQKMITDIILTFIRVINGTDIFLTTNHYDKPEKILFKQRSLFNDMKFALAPLERGQINPISRPFIETGLLAMTQHRGYMSQLQKILSVVDIYSNIGVCIVLLVTMMFFKFVIHQNLTGSFLNVMRIVCNTGFENIPENASPRLYLTTVLIFAVIMQGIYQGNLAALLTTNVPLRNVVTWQDLIDFGLTIYTAKSNRPIFKEREFEGHIIPVKENGDCSEYVLRDSMAACVSFAVLLMNQAEKLNLHLSERLRQSLAVYMFSPDWPLEEQLNLVLGKLFEADLIIPFELRRYRTTLNNIKVMQVADDDDQVRNITLSDLAFAFVILGIGLTCASIAFAIEIINHRIGSRARITRFKK